MTAHDGWMLLTDSATNDDLPALISAVEGHWGAAHLDELPETLSDKELVNAAVTAGALSRGDTTVEELRDLLTSRYDATARKRLEEVEPRTRSPLEAPVRVWLRRAGFEVECCVPIEGVGEVDHVVDGWLILEEDGFEFHCSQEQFRADRRRVSAAGALGYPTLRLTHEDIRAGEEHVVRTVSDFMIGLARSPRISLPKNVEILRKRGIHV